MKIPKQAKLVFKGEIFNTYQWQQEMYDGTFETFEMLDRTNTIQVIPVMDDKIILIDEEQPTIKRGLAVIGGRQDKDEIEIECAKRELLEETGLASDDWELWEEIEPYNKIDWKVSRFIAHNCKKVAEQKLDAGEKIELKPVNFDDFIKIACDKNFGSKDISLSVLRMLYENTLEDFKQKLFKN